MTGEFNQETRTATRRAVCTYDDNGIKGLNIKLCNNLANFTFTSKCESAELSGNKIILKGSTPNYNEFTIDVPKDSNNKVDISFENLNTVNTRPRLVIDF